MLLADFDSLYTRRHEPETLEQCLQALNEAHGDFEWSWRRARLSHFRAMQASESGDQPRAKTLFQEGVRAADVACKLDASRVEGAFWSGTCELEAARASGTLALATRLWHAHKSIERSARSNEEFHYAGPLRVLGRITHFKPLALGGTLDGAIAFYERALQIAPRNSTNNLYFADALLADRQPRRARQALKDVLESDPFDWTWETERDQKIAREWLVSRLD